MLPIPEPLRQHVAVVLRCTPEEAERRIRQLRVGEKISLGHIAQRDVFAQFFVVSKGDMLEYHIHIEQLHFYIFRSEGGSIYTHEYFDRALARWKELVQKYG